MPPKLKKESNKTVQKKNEKIIEDKTFGLKNKKGGKQQKFIKTVTNQIRNDPNQTRNIGKDKKKDDDLEDLTKIYKPVLQEQKISQGVDPKSVLCAFFKQGTCLKGNKCKFSHDLTIERRTEKRSLYTDVRNEEDTMENWDETKLEEVVAQKHGEENKQSNKTDIICKHFLQAVEDNKYGWFWECPSGEKCIYRHAVPPGFVLNTKKDKDAIKEAAPLLEDLLDEKRASLKAHTKVTLESFRAWKDKRLTEKRKRTEADTRKKEEKFRMGKLLGLSGREMFTFDPNLVSQDNYYQEGETLDFDRSTDFPSAQDPSNDDDDGDELEIYELLKQNRAAQELEQLDKEIELELSNLICMEMSSLACPLPFQQNSPPGEKKSDLPTREHLQNDHNYHHLFNGDKGLPDLQNRH